MSMMSARPRVGTHDPQSMVGHVALCLVPLYIDGLERFADSSPGQEVDEAAVRSWNLSSHDDQALAEHGRDSM
jgi:hypothetical protein